MLPNFLIIGTGRAGSSWLKACLQDHPDVFMYRPGEIHFFDRHYDKGVTWYQSHFRGWSGQRAVGEKTPGYLADQDAPSRIRATLSDDVRLIASLRNPVERVYSNYQRFIRNGEIAPDTDFCDFYAEAKGLREEGLYYAHLSRYLEYFPPERLLVMIYEEEIVKDPSAAIRRCFEFLGVDKDHICEVLNSRVNVSREARVLARQVRALRRMTRSLTPGMERAVVKFGRQVVGLLPSRGGGDSLPEDMRQRLMGEFMSDIRNLEDLIDRDLALWYRPAET